MNYQKFEALLKQSKTTVYRVYKDTGISPLSFTDWKNGRSAPKADKLKLIADYFGISVDLLLGSESGRSRNDAVYRTVVAGKMVPVIENIEAGKPIVNERSLIGHEFADIDDPDDYFYLRVCGDSMINCGMVDGSLVLFRKQQCAENGNIVACHIGNSNAVIRRYGRIRREIILTSENEAYAPLALSTDDFESGAALLLGVAIEVRTKL